MSKLDRFLAKPVEVTIAGEQFMLKPLTVNDLPLLTRLESRDDGIKAKATQDVIKSVLKQIDREATEEQMNNVAVEYLEDIMNAFGKVNGTDMTDAKKKLLEKANESAK
jgi:hypothetical protein